MVLDGPVWPGLDRDRESLHIVRPDQGQPALVQRWPASPGDLGPGTVQPIGTRHGTVNHAPDRPKSQGRPGHEHLLVRPGSNRGGHNVHEVMTIATLIEIQLNSRFPLSASVHLVLRLPRAGAPLSSNRKIRGLDTTSPL